MSFFGEAPVSGFNEGRPLSTGRFETYGSLVSGALEESVTGFAFRELARLGDNSKELSIEQANETYGIEGHLQFDKAVTEDRAIELMAIKQRELARADVLSRSTVGGIEQFGVSLAASLLDPLGDALAFLPVVGYTKFTTAATSATKAVTLSSRLTRGFGEGVVAGAATEAVIFPLATYREKRDYGAEDILMSLALSGGLGAAARGIFGRSRPEQASTPDEVDIAGFLEGPDERLALPAPEAPLLLETQAPLGLPAPDVIRMPGFIEGQSPEFFQAQDKKAREAQQLEDYNKWMAEFGAEPVDRLPDKIIPEGPLLLETQVPLGLPAPDVIRQPGFFEGQSPEFFQAQDKKAREAQQLEDYNKWMAEFGAEPVDRLPDEIIHASKETRQAAFSEAVRAFSEGEPVMSAEILTEASKNRQARLDEPGKPIQKQSIRSDIAIDPAGGETQVEYAIVEAEDLITSHDDNLSIEGRYPQELQPRDRTRASSITQINDLASNLKPPLLGESPQADVGSPIISADGVVESGNARTISLRRAVLNGTEKGLEYNQWLRAQNYPIDGFKYPVLVRIADPSRTGEQRLKFVRDANGRTTAAMSATERALSDAQALQPQDFELHSGGDAGLVRNVSFVKRIIERIAPEQERGALIDKRGHLSAEGQRRVEGAIAAYAYDEPNLIASLIETKDEVLRGIGKSLIEHAPTWARLRSSVRSGDVDSRTDLTAHLVSATEIVRDARAAGITINEKIGRAETDMFGTGIDPRTQTFLRIFFSGDNFDRQRSQAKIKADLDYYVQEAEKAKPGPNLFGGNDEDPAQRILARLLDNAESRAKEQSGLDPSTRPELFSDVEATNAPGQGGAVFGDGSGSQGAPETVNTPSIDESAELTIQESVGDSPDATLQNDIDLLDEDVRAAIDNGLLTAEDVAPRQDIDPAREQERIDKLPDLMKSAAFCIKNGGGQ